MSLDLPRRGALSGVRPGPAILIVDDDARVVEMLEIALEAHGYRVLRAADGEEAVDVARRDRPDLVVLDVRLPKRSGFDVCQRLRSDPDDPLVPIIMVSAAAEVDSRVQGLAHGADDYLIKPFSPKELVARIQRLLARAGEARDARRSGAAAEAELMRAREEAQRTQRELRLERLMAERARTLSETLGACADLDAIADALLMAVARDTGLDAAALLVPGEQADRLEPIAVHGLERARVRGLSLARDGEVARLLAGLGRVVRHEELERLPELRAELPPLAAPGFSALAGLRADEGLEGVLLLGERSDGAPLDRERLALVTALCDTAAHAMAQARRLAEPLESTVELMGALAGNAGTTPRARAVEEATEVLERVARELLFPARERRLIRWAMRVGRAGVEGDGDLRLASAALKDATGSLARLRRLVRLARQTPAPGAAAGPETLVALGWRAVDDRTEGSPAVLAWGRALSLATADPDLVTLVREALIALRTGETRAA